MEFFFSYVNNLCKVRWKDRVKERVLDRGIGIEQSRRKCVDREVEALPVLRTFSEGMRYQRLYNFFFLSCTCSACRLDGGYLDNQPPPVSSTGFRFFIVTPSFLC